jgi:hypothetical protein
MPETLRGAERQYRVVETAIRDAEWPYDNGDDPSFYAARKGGRLTWGVCREDLRNAITTESIVVFFSFTPISHDEILYRLCAVATVEAKLDHRSIHRDRILSKLRALYINGLISPERGGWRYDETDRRSSQRHKDWLWRIACHRGIAKEKFKKKYAAIYRDEWFPDGAVADDQLRLAGNYILFSTTPDMGFISRDPPVVAVAAKGKSERWIDPKLQGLTVGKAAAFLKSGRDYLRVANRSGRNVHRQIHFDMPADEAIAWRDSLIAALKEATDNPTRHKTKRARAAVTVKC